VETLCTHKTFVVLTTKITSKKSKNIRMNKTMTVDILSSIKGAKPSDTVSKLFEIIKNANTSSTNFYSKNHQNAVSLDELREDIVIESSDLEKKIIIENFPKEKKGYLVVSKVIEE